MKNTGWEPVNTFEEKKAVAANSWEPINPEKNKFLQSGQTQGSRNIKKDDLGWVIDFADQDWIDEIKRKGPI